MSSAVNEASAEDVARVTVISPTRRIDLALPGSTTLGELMPNIVRFSGYEGGGAQEAVQAWVLQRFGEDPLDADRPVAELNLRDGETLHLRHREAALPDAAFDDVVDAVATATGTQPLWSNTDSRRFTLVFVAVLAVLLPGFAVAASPGWLVAAAVLVLALACGFTAVLLARAFGLKAVSGTLAWVAVALTAIGGYAILPGTPLLPRGDTGVQILLAGSLVLAMAGAMALGTQVTAYPLLGVSCAAAVIVLAAMAAVLLPNRQVHAAAIALAVVMAVTAWLPTLAFRVAGVAMPNLPATAEALMADKQPVQHDIVTRAISAERFLSAFLVGSALSAALLSIPVLVLGQGWAPTALIAACALALLLRARSFTGRTARLSLLSAGTFMALAAIATALSGFESPLSRALAGMLIVVLGIWFGSQYAATGWNRVLSPVWGRWGDVFEWIAVIAILPLLLAVLDLYSWAYGLGG
ncbi:type VII secretion integral membrane protein EccD [Naumannella sp. ID2617S]|nr:type VII secretion integral membrane protein EccD [Naumannella sp. ID2617S]